MRIPCSGCDNMKPAEAYPGLALFSQSVPQTEKPKRIQGTIATVRSLPKPTLVWHYLVSLFLKQRNLRGFRAGSIATTMWKS